jgi:hypothetical protein
LLTWKNFQRTGACSVRVRALRQWRSRAWAASIKPVPPVRTACWQGNFHDRIIPFRNPGAAQRIASRPTREQFDFDRHWRNARTHTLHYKYANVGNYYPNKVLPRHGAI